MNLPSLSPFLVWLTVYLYSFIFLSLSTHAETSNVKPVLIGPESFQAGFLVRLYSVQPDRENAFINHLQDCFVPVSPNH